MLHLPLVSTLKRLEKTLLAIANQVTCAYFYIITGVFIYMWIEFQVMKYNEHNASARGVKMITISRAQRGSSITEPTAQQEVLLVI